MPEHTPTSFRTQRAVSAALTMKSIVQSGGLNVQFRHRRPVNP